MKRLASMSAAVILMMMAGCATKSSVTPAPEKPLTAFGCPVGGKSIGSMEDLLASKVQTAGDVKDGRRTLAALAKGGEVLQSTRHDFRAEFFQGRQRPAGEDPHLAAVGQQAFGELAADETAGAGHEDGAAHRFKAAVKTSRLSIS